MRSMASLTLCQEEGPLRPEEGIPRPEDGNPNPEAFAEGFNASEISEGGGNLPT